MFKKYLFILIAMLTISGMAFSQTIINNDIDTQPECSWTTTGSPYYVVVTVSVTNDLTLNIEAGVEVYFSPDVSLIVEDGSSIEAIGSSSNPILFSSSEATPAAGDWGQIEFDGTDGSVSGYFQWCIIEYGGDTDISVWHPLGPILVMDDTDLIIAKSFIRHCLGSGIGVDDAAADVYLDVLETRILNCQSGININSLDAADTPGNEIKNNIIAGMSDYGIVHSDGGVVDLTICNNVIAYCGLTGYWAATLTSFFNNTIANVEDDGIFIESVAATYSFYNNLVYNYGDDANDYGMESDVNVVQSYGYSYNSANPANYSDANVTINPRITAATPLFTWDNWNAGTPDIDDINYHLQFSSSCRNTGLPTRFDYNGRSRSDLGAYGGPYCNDYYVSFTGGNFPASITSEGSPYYVFDDVTVNATTSITSTYSAVDYDCFFYFDQGVSLIVNDELDVLGHTDHHVVFTSMIYTQHWDGIVLPPGTTTTRTLDAFALEISNANMGIYASGCILDLILGRPTIYRCNYGILLNNLLTGTSIEILNVPNIYNNLYGILANIVPDFNLYGANINNCNTGVYLYSCTATTALIDNCNIEYCNSYGIYINSSDVQITNYMDINNCGTSGIYIYNDSEVEISDGVEIYECGYGILAVNDSETIEIFGTDDDPEWVHIYDCEDECILLYNTDDVYLGYAELESDHTAGNTDGTVIDLSSGSYINEYGDSYPVDLISSRYNIVQLYDSNDGGCIAGSSAGNGNFFDLYWDDTVTGDYIIKYTDWDLGITIPVFTVSYNWWEREPVNADFTPNGCIYYAFGAMWPNDDSNGFGTTSIDNPNLTFNEDYRKYHDLEKTDPQAAYNGYRQMLNQLIGNPNATHVAKRMTLIGDKGYVEISQVEEDIDNFINRNSIAGDDTGNMNFHLKRAKDKCAIYAGDYERATRVLNERQMEAPRSIDSLLIEMDLLEVERFSSSDHASKGNFQVSQAKYENRLETIIQEIEEAKKQSEIKNNEDFNATMVEEFRLEDSYPNPFNATISINYSMPYSSQVNIAVYNILGEKIATLVDEHLAAGKHRTVWQGQNAFGNTVASGIYFVKMSAPGTVQTQKIMLIK